MRSAPPNPAGMLRLLPTAIVGRPSVVALRLRARSVRFDVRQSGPSFSGWPRRLSPVGSPARGSMRGLHSISLVALLVWLVSPGSVAPSDAKRDHHHHRNVTELRNDALLDADRRAGRPKLTETDGENTLSAVKSPVAESIGQEFTPPSRESDGKQEVPIPLLLVLANAVMLLIVVRAVVARRDHPHLAPPRSSRLAGGERAWLRVDSPPAERLLQEPAPRSREGEGQPEGVAVGLLRILATAGILFMVVRAVLARRDLPPVARARRSRFARGSTFVKERRLSCGSRRYPWNPTEVGLRDSHTKMGRMTETSSRSPMKRGSLQERRGSPCAACNEEHFAHVHAIVGAREPTEGRRDMPSARPAGGRGVWPQARRGGRPLACCSLCDFETALTFAARGPGTAAPHEHGNSRAGLANGRGLSHRRSQAVP